MSNVSRLTLVSDQSSARSSDAGRLLRVLLARRSVPALWLGAPGPSPDELRQLLTAASRVPDHGALVPWRFLVVEGPARQDLSRRLQACFVAANGQADQAAVDQSARKIEALFASPPVTVVVVSRVDPRARVPEWEQILSAGAACMNLMAAAAALGYRTNWLTGWATYDAAARAGVGLSATERIAGIIPIGTASEQPAERPRPGLDTLVTAWSPPA